MIAFGNNTINFDKNKLFFSTYPIFYLGECVNGDFPRVSDPILD
jgi:hypothetical protein